MKKILLLIILFPSIVFAQNDWYYTNPYPTNNNLYDVHFIDENTGYIAGDGGAFLKTTNGGNNWIQRNLLGELSSVQDFEFIDDNIVYAAGYNDHFFKSTNAGINWTNHHLNINLSNTYPKKISFLNESTGFCVDGKIYKTIDAGNSWTFVSISNNEHHFFNMNVVNAGLILACGRKSDYSTAGLFKSTDLGNTWIQINLNENYIRELDRIKFLNSTTGIISGLYSNPITNITCNSFVITTDGGATWNKKYFFLESTFKQILDLSFYNDINNLYAVSAHKVYKSTNGGNNWTENLDVPTNFYMMKMSAINQTFYCVGTNGKILKSTNAGADWENLRKSYSNANLSGISFANNLTGITTGNNTLLRTTDGGINWNKIILDSTYSNSRCKLFDDGTGFILCNIGYIMKTTNFGLNWNYINLNTSTHFSDMFFLDRQNGVISSFMKIWITSNGGTDWEEKSIGTVENIIMITPTKLIGDGVSNPPHMPGINYIAYSSNKGTNWISTYWAEGSTPGFESFYFIDSLYGWASGSYYSRLKTTNGGLNWTDYGNPAEYRAFSNLHAVNRNIVFGTSSFGIEYSNDGGMTWKLSSNIAQNGIYASEFLENGKAFYAGGFGSIITCDNTNNVVNIENTSSSSGLVKSYSLSQNYPNPFNPATNIEFQIPNPELVSLKVYDIAGKLVTTLVNENLSAGNYKVQFNGLSFSSGVYFYTLETESLIQTRKMLLIK